MDLKLQGKKAIITGGTRGIGRYLTEVFMDEGVEVAICGRNNEGVQKTIKELSLKGKIFGEAVDISHHKPFENWMTETTQRLGGLDILILNAGAMVAENSDEDWLRNFNVDLMGAVHATKIAKPFLAEAAAMKGDAAIIYISSISASEAHGESSYGPIKAALIHFAKGVAKEVAKQKIRANVISPGPVYVSEGGFWQQMEIENPTLFKEVLEQAPLGRMAKPEEIAYAALFLASPLSSYTTGTNLIIDGGYTNKVDF